MKLNQQSNPFWNISFGLILFFSSAAYATPEIETVNSADSLAHGQSFVISGTGFGLKDPATPMFWDTIDNQEAYDGWSDGEVVPVLAGGCEDCPWRDNIPDSWGDEPRFSTDDPRASHPHYRVIGKGFLRSQDDFSIANDLIANYWMRVDATPGYNGQGNFKFNRLYVDDNGFSSYGGCTCQTSLCGCTVSEDLSTETQWVSWGGDVSYVWHHIEITADDRDGGYASGNGEFSFYVDNDRIFHFDNVYAGYPLKYFHVLGFDSLDDWRDHFSDTTMDWGEIYIDNTLAKIAIGDAPNWTSVSHWEIQIPEAWSSTEARFRANQGSFSREESYYLYVFDAEGVMNEEGFPVVFSSASNDDSPTNSSGCQAASSPWAFFLLFLVVYFRLNTARVSKW